MNADANPAKAIFLEAVENHDPDLWPAFLDHACAGRPELRRRVEVLLQAHREAGTDQHAQRAEDDDAPSPAATTDEPPLAERPGTVIGPYKLLEQIGEGGFGIVFMAEQTHPVRRLVALKVLKPGMDTRTSPKCSTPAPPRRAGLTSSWSWSKAYPSPATATSSG
jgi:hypothetical protein